MLEGLATISAVLYANTNHPELKIDFPNWNERCKQILKKWRALSTERKAPYLQKARENRSCMKKAQQVSRCSEIIKMNEYKKIIDEQLTFRESLEDEIVTVYDLKSTSNKYILFSANEHCKTIFTIIPNIQILFYHMLITK